MPPAHPWALQPSSCLVCHLSQPFGGIGDQTLLGIPAEAADSLRCAWGQSCAGDVTEGSHRCVLALPGAAVGEPRPRWRCRAVFRREPERAVHPRALFLPPHPHPAVSPAVTQPPVAPGAVAPAHGGLGALGRAGGGGREPPPAPPSRLGYTTLSFHNTLKYT